MPPRRTSVCIREEVQMSQPCTFNCMGLQVSIRLQSYELKLQAGTSKSKQPHPPLLYPISKLLVWESGLGVLLRAHLPIGKCFSSANLNKPPSVSTQAVGLETSICELELCTVPISSTWARLRSALPQSTLKTLTPGPSHFIPWSFHFQESGMRHREFASGERQRGKQIM